MAENHPEPGPLAASIRRAGTALTPSAVKAQRWMMACLLSGERRAASGELIKVFDYQNRPGQPRYPTNGRKTFLIVLHSCLTGLRGTGALNDHLSNYHPRFDKRRAAAVSCRSHGDPHIPSSTLARWGLLCGLTAYTLAHAVTGQALTQHLKIHPSCSEVSHAPVPSILDQYNTDGLVTSSSFTIRKRGTCGVGNVQCRRAKRMR